MTGLSMPVFTGPKLRAWPGHEDGGRAEYYSSACALRTVYPTDAHTAAYSVELVKRRLDSAAPGHKHHRTARLIVPMAFLFVDVDGADHKADPAWRESEVGKIELALAKLPGGFSYQTRGGYRLVWRLMAPFSIASDTDAAAWKLTYWRALLLLSRRFGIVGDPACADWTRLYRLPHATRDSGGSPEALPTTGDPELAKSLKLTLDPAELAADLAEARRLNALYPAVRDDNGKVRIAGSWGAAVRALAREAGEPEGEGAGASPPWAPDTRAPASAGASRGGRPDREERERLWCERALDRMADELGRMVKGGRNNAARDAGLVLGHYAPHLLDPARIERALLAACERNGLVRDDGGRDGALVTIRRAISDGMAEPKRPDLPADEPRRERSTHQTTDRTGPTMHSAADHQEQDQEPASARRPANGNRGDERPCVLLDFETGERVREAERHLAARSDLNLYTRDGRLVCVDTATKGKRRVWRDDAGTPLARDLSLAALRCLITDCMRFERWQKEGKGEDAAQVRVSCRPHDDIVRGLHGATGWPELRDLVGIVRAPFLGSLAGDVVATSGYHESSGYLLTMPGDDAATVPERPTRQQALEALATLRDELLCDFPFASPQDRSVALAALLTLQARPALGANNAPGVLFEANTPSSGKTLLADVCAIVGSGAMAPKHGFTTDDREMDKTLGGIASEARAVVCFDNITDPIGGASLDRALTCSGSLAYRLLGQNRTAQAVWRTTVFFTANNATIGGDVGRRLLVCRLESEHERPGLREGFRHDDLRGYATTHRTRFAALGLTILRAFCQLPAAERPHVAPLGSFEAWARLVAGALVWLGEADPIGAVADERAGGVDLARVALGTLVQGWNNLRTATRSKLRWTDKGIMVKAALEALYVNGAPAEGDGLDDLREALEVLTSPGAGKAPSVRQVGNTLARFRGRVVDGRRLMGEQDRNGVMAWRVEETRSTKGGGAGSAGSCGVSSKQAEDKDREGAPPSPGSYSVPREGRKTTPQDPADPADGPAPSATPPPVSGVANAPDGDEFEPEERYPAGVA